MVWGKKDGDSVTEYNTIQYSTILLSLCREIYRMSVWMCVCVCTGYHDVWLNVLGCRVDILGTNCSKLLKLKINWRGGGGGVGSASVRVTMSGGSKAPTTEYYLLTVMKYHVSGNQSPQKCLLTQHATPSVPSYDSSVSVDNV